MEILNWIFAAIFCWLMIGFFAFIAGVKYIPNFDHNASLSDAVKASWWGPIVVVAAVWALWTEVWEPYLKTKKIKREYPSSDSSH